VTSTKQFVISGKERCETRDNSSAIATQFFDWGQKAAGTSLFYTVDQIGSVKELTNGSGIIQSQYAYSPFGIPTKLQGGSDSDIQFTGLYSHSRSGLNLAQQRNYNPLVAKWLSRDPSGEFTDGPNLYCYVENQPNSHRDLSGTNTMAGAMIGSGFGPVGTIIGGVIGTMAAIGIGYAAAQIVKEKTKCIEVEDCRPPLDDMGNLSACLEWCRSQCKSSGGYSVCWDSCMQHQW